MTHPYFECRAETYITRSGGPAGISAQLAAWAERTRQGGYRPVGTIVGFDGTLHVRIQHLRSQGWVITHTFTPEGARAAGLGHSGKDATFHALTRILREAGQDSRLLQVHYSDVCEGRCGCGKHRRPYPDADPRSRHTPGVRATTLEEAPY